MNAGEPAQGCLSIQGKGGERGAVQADKRTDGSSREMGWATRACWQRASVFLPCAEWRMRMRWARAMEQVLRREAEAVGEGGDEQFGG